MKRKQSTEEQIITILKEAEAGAKVGDLIRRHGIEGRSYREISERLELSKSVVYRYLKASA